MEQDNYLKWLVKETPTTWWQDSLDPEELDRGIANGATGLTSNPLLAYQAMMGRPDYWKASVQALPADLKGDERAEALMRIAVTHAAGELIPAYQRTGKRQGYASAQVNPTKAADREAMLAQAKRHHAWAPNITVKLPATAAGLDVMEECAAAGISFNATVSFTASQALAIGERAQKGTARARSNGVNPAPCFITIMIGRLDDYLRDVAQDQKADITESDIRQSGLAVVKRAYAIFKERNYDALLVIAALRGAYHMTELAGGKMIMSIHPSNQAKLLQPGVSRDLGIENPIASDALARLCKLREFVKAYEPDGLRPDDFYSYGVTQRTLTQFSEVGWRMLETVGKKS